MVMDMGAVSAVDYGVYRCAFGDDRADGVWVAEMMDAVEFFKEHGRMCDSLAPSCIGCEIMKSVAYTTDGHGTCREYIKRHPDEAVAIVERWAKEHPRKTRQSEFLKMFPRASMTADGIIAFCPDSMDSEFECPRKTRDNIDPICGECRREYWLEEVEDDER